jgi:hypothetical protein
LSVLALAAGCKDKPAAKQTPPANAGSAAGSAGSAKGPVAAPDLKLPHSDGTPPKKTTAPLTKTDFERLAKLEYPGFIADVRTVGEKVFDVRQKTKDHPRLWAVVVIKPCLDCLPMELDKWKAKEAEIKQINLEGLKDIPGVEWEMGETSLNGQKIIYTYQIGAGNQPGEGGGQYVFGDAYFAYYNDGVNEIRVVASYKDDPVAVESLKKLAPKDDLRALALSFLDVYTHEW